MSWALYPILAIPLGATLLTLLDGWKLARAATAIAGGCSLGLAVAIGLSVRHGQVLVAAAGWLRVDALGAVFLLGTGLLYAMAAVFSIGYLGVEQHTPGFPSFAKRYYTLLNLFGCSMLLVPLASDFGTLWVAVEMTTIISALLVAIDRTDAALEAAWKYVLIASSGLGIALLSIIILYATGTHALGTAYIPRFVRFSAHARSLSTEAVQVAFVLSVVGFGTKVGFVPMHTWLPDAHSEAPAPVSALLSGSLLSAAFYAILRFFQVAVANGDRSFAEHVLIVFGTMSLVAAGFFVLRQRNYKRLLAYSSVEHMGIIALGIGFGAPLAVAGALLHVLTHAAAKGLAFLGAGSLLRGYDSKEVASVRGAGRTMPWTGPMFLAATLALSGLPLSGVFRSEFEVVVGGFASSQNVGVVLLLIFVNLAFFGVIWHAGGMILTSPATPATTSGSATGASSGIGAAASTPPSADVPHERSAWMIAGMLGCLFVVVALGVHLPGELSSLLGHAAGLLRRPGR